MTRLTEECFTKVTPTDADQQPRDFFGLTENLKSLKPIKNSSYARYSEIKHKIFVTFPNIYKNSKSQNLSHFRNFPNMHDTYVLKVFLVNICHWREKTDNTQILVAKTPRKPTFRIVTLDNGNLSNACT